MKMIKKATLNLSALEELRDLVANGFTFEIMKASDGADIVMASKVTVNASYSRMFLLDITEVEELPTTKNDLGVDCISRAEVIEEINSVANDAWDEEQMRVDLIAEINALPSVTPQDPRWIPVSERLPEELLGVLVYCPTYDNIYCAYLEKGEWKIFSKQADENINEAVVAWQSLPEHYKMVEPQESEETYEQTI